MVWSNFGSFRLYFGENIWNELYKNIVLIYDVSIFFYLVMRIIIIDIIISLLTMITPNDYTKSRKQWGNNYGVTTIKTRNIFQQPDKDSYHIIRINIFSLHSFLVSRSNYCHELTKVNDLRFHQYTTENVRERIECNPVVNLIYQSTEEYLVRPKS